MLLAFYCSEFSNWILPLKLYFIEEVTLKSLTIQRFCEETICNGSYSEFSNRIRSLKWFSIKEFFIYFSFPLRYWIYVFYLIKIYYWFQKITKWALLVLQISNECYWYLEFEKWVLMFFLLIAVTLNVYIANWIMMCHIFKWNEDFLFKNLQNRFLHVGNPWSNISPVS